MSAPKTRPTTESVENYLAEVTGPERQADCRTLVEMMRRASGAEAVMWGTSIVGFGTTPMRYASGSTLDWPVIGFSPRKEALTLYLMGGLANSQDLLDRLGRFKTGKGCLYIKRLRDVDPDVLEQLLRRSVAALKPT